MTRKVTELVEECFKRHDGDGEFVVGTRLAPFSVVPPASKSDRLVFTTKPAVLLAAKELWMEPEVFGMIGRYGLPCRSDRDWICDVIGSRTLLFLGDMDPVDLLVFAWLRAAVHPKRVRYSGINDELVDVLQIPSLESVSIPCSASECEELTVLLEAFPDHLQNLGARCTKTLHAGRKVEMEAILSANMASLIQFWSDGEVDGS